MMITQAARLNGQIRSYTVYMVDTTWAQHGFAWRVERLQWCLGNGEAQNRWVGDEIFIGLFAAATSRPV